MMRYKDVSSIAKNDFEEDLVSCARPCVLYVRPTTKNQER